MLLAPVLAIAALAGWFVIPDMISGGGERPVALESPPLSIAVLPFSNLSGDADQDYFADALTEDLTTDLSRISGSFVISRSTAATYRGRDQDTSEVARELNVRYLLEGTVRKAGELVRVGVQLTDGETGQQVWSERYEKAAGDMYAFQNEVTGQLARSLNLELKDAESRQAARGKASNADAADLALRAWAELWTKPQTRETNDAALAYVARALEVDPDNAEASGVAAYAYARAATYGWGMSRDAAIKAGITDAEKSLSFDPRNADTVYALGFLYYVQGDTERSLEQMRQCIALNRNHAPAYFFHGLNLIRLDHPRDAISWVERAFALSPRDPLRSVWYGAIGRAQVLIGENKLAVETPQKGVAANPKHPHNYAVLASAYAHLGDMERAQAALGEFLDRQAGMTIGRYWRNLASGDPRAMEAYAPLIIGLRKAGLPE
jgi:TolB-like protein/Tfp pilus assembly protein PilF